MDRTKTLVRTSLCTSREDSEQPRYAMGCGNPVEYGFYRDSEKQFKNAICQSV